MTAVPPKIEAEAAVLSWRPDGEITDLIPLTGGTSGPAFRIDLALPEGDRSVVWRRPHQAGSARIEFNCLGRVRKFGIPAPEPLAFSDDGWSLMAFVPGGPAADPVMAAERCAECLAAVHRVDFTHLGLPNAQDRLTFWAQSESPYAELLRKRMPAPPTAPVLLHGDLWPGNTLWTTEGELAALIDWESAMLGDPWSDVGTARLEILWAWGRPAMEAFTARFAAQCPQPPGALAAWEIAAVIRLEPHLSHFGLSKPKKGGTAL
jgi:aminoglycoside phosphotransferase (APT) family kinase protein